MPGSSRRRPPKMFYCSSAAEQSLQGCSPRLFQRRLRGKVHSDRQACSDGGCHL